MKNKLSQEYKDDLYEKVLEKKRIRTIKRKKMLSVFIIFISLVGFTTIGFSLRGQDDYNNFFISKTENIMIEDEYQYFDDLGIKLEFINIDDNSLTLGINIKYEDIAKYQFDFEEITMLDLNGEVVIKDNVFNCKNRYNIDNKMNNRKKISKSEIVYIVEYEYKEKFEIEDSVLKIKNLIIDINTKKNKCEFEYEKKISIEE